MMRVEIWPIRWALISGIPITKSGCAASSVLPSRGWCWICHRPRNRPTSPRRYSLKATTNFNESWTLTLGGRYTKDKKTTDQAGIVTATAKEDWNKFTPKVAIKYNLNDDSMIYGLFSGGYRAGGFNGRVDGIETATTPYDPETVDNWELGLPF